VSAPGLTNNTNNSAPGLAGFFAYRGARDDDFGIEEGPLTYSVDALFLGLMATMIYRNAVLYPHPMVWVLGLVTSIHIAILIGRPHRQIHWRVVLFATAAVVLAMVVPVRIGENIFVASFVACMGCLALFFVRGTQTAITGAAAYVGYTAYMVQYTTHGFGDPKFTGIMLAGLGIVILGTLMMLHHFMIRLDSTNLQLRQATAALQQSLDSLQFSASAGGVALWDYDRDTDEWHVNEVFRTLTDLPHEQYPVLYSDVVAKRLPEAFREQIMERIRGQEDQDVELLEVTRPDGTVVLCEGMSKFYPLSGGHAIRRGILIAVSEPEPVIRS